MKELFLLNRVCVCMCVHAHTGGHRVQKRMIDSRIRGSCEPTTWMLRIELWSWRRATDAITTELYLPPPPPQQKSTREINSKRIWNYPYKKLKANCESHLRKKDEERYIIVSDCSKKKTKLG